MGGLLLSESCRGGFSQFLTEYINTNFAEYVYKTHLKIQNVFDS